MLLLVGALAAGARLLGGETPAGQERWLKVTLPELTIITSLDEPRAAAWGRELAAYVVALHGFFRDTPVQPAPLTLVLFARKPEFLRYRPLDKKGRPEWVGGFFLRRVSWSVIGVPASSEDDLRHKLFHETAHWFVDGAGYANALWLNEGMAEVFSTFRVDNGQACWGDLLPEHVALLHRRSPEPIEQVIFASRDLVARDLDRSSRFYAESWAFVHMVLFGETKVPREGLVAYNRALEAHVNADGAFATSFGLTYAEMDQELARYATGEPHHELREPLGVVPAIRVEPATPIEVDDALGRLALAGNHDAEAFRRGRAMVRDAPQDPRGHALLAMACRQLGEEASARQEFELAVRYGATDFEPYFELGNAVQDPTIGGTADLSGADARRAADYYETAIERYDRFEGSYANLARVIGLVEPMQDRDIAMLRAGAHRFPDNAMISLGIAQWYDRTGDHDAARGLVAEVVAKTGGLRSPAHDFARQLQDRLEDQKVFGEVAQLTVAKRFDEALALVDRIPVVGRDLSRPWQLRTLHADIVAARAVAGLNEALAQQHWSEARGQIAAILASNAPPAVKMSVRATLRMLDGR